jgi:hypothetical protein
MFSWLFLVTVLPTWLVAMAILWYLRRRQRELDKNRVPQLIAAKRSSAE